MSLLLLEKILSLFLITLAGFVIVRLGILKAEDSKCLSTLSIYLIVPCTIISSFQVERSPEVEQGLLFAFAAAFAVQIFMIIAVKLLEKPLKLSPLERVAVIYSNCGNLIIPLVSLILGKEWIIYTCAFICAHCVFIWSHGRMVLSTGEKPGIGKILTSSNMIAIYIGVLLFIFEIRFPFPIQDAVDSLAGMVGPIAMLISGMLIGGMDLKKLLSYKRAWLAAALRLLVLPLVVLPVFRFSGIASLHPQGSLLLIITLLAAGAPTASNVVQMTQVYGGDENYASAINVLTIVLCVVTMPLLIELYTRL